MTILHDREARSILDPTVQISATTAVLLTEPATVTVRPIVGLLGVAFGTPGPSVRYVRVDDEERYVAAFDRNVWTERDARIFMRVALRTRDIQFVTQAEIAAGAL